MDNIELALKYNPQSYKAYYYKGVIYGIQNKIEKAIEMFNIALIINPTHEKSLMNKFNCIEIKDVK